MNILIWKDIEIDVQIKCYGWTLLVEKQQQQQQREKNDAKWILEYSTWEISYSNKTGYRFFVIVCDFYLIKTYRYKMTRSKLDEKHKAITFLNHNFSFCSKSLLEIWLLSFNQFYYWITITCSFLSLFLLCVYVCVKTIQTNFTVFDFIHFVPIERRGA